MSFELNIPVCSERVESGEGRPIYEVWSLFAPQYRAFNEREDRALNSLRRAIEVDLNGAAKSLDHSWISFLSFCPDLASRRVALDIGLRKRSIKGEFFLVSFAALDRRIVLCPRIEEFSFEIQRGQDLLTRATDVFTAHFRRIFRR
jgi:hypothetical protein